MKKPSLSGPRKFKLIPVEHLTNIGPTIAKRLHEIGIESKDDLQKIGAVGAYRRLRAQRPGRTIPVCYYLYSLEGALRDKHWDSLDASVKRALRAQIDGVPTAARERDVHGKGSPRK